LDFTAGLVAHHQSFRASSVRIALDRDPIVSDHDLIFCLSMIFSENRFPPIGSLPDGMLFGIML
jgi:hypothetical protein